ncbi:hypothetical protein NP233_g3153 [Leucocoprinus birnbaumii]|uniref:AB hydrolase-1 domain-containing protein n=1 Tax=Leucocoprinus birnbaumii TaxID=56174 RepID=A0AAD5W0V2_9AGAR|nr:hypothetical protein NP233_g3153 [Leucocoprinus birnbaumii]
MQCHPVVAYVDEKRRECGSLPLRYLDVQELQIEDEDEEMDYESDESAEFSPGGAFDDPEFDRSFTPAALQYHSNFFQRLERWSSSTHGVDTTSLRPQRQLEADWMRPWWEIDHSRREPEVCFYGLLAMLAGFLGLCVSYMVAVGLAMIPVVQTYITYAHRIDFFGYTKFDHPEDYGLAPGKTVNLHIQSLDSTTLGAWFIFAESFRHQTPLLAPAQSHGPNDIRSAIKARPTILYLHGNTGTRALPVRVTVYTGLTGRLDVNVFTIDYRGFGDSDGHPTVDGVTRDARAAWDYLMLQGAKPQDVLIVGHSLGTAIASLLAADLARDDVEPRGLVLMSAFSSIRKLMDQYHLFGFLPLLRPLTVVPFAPRVLDWSLKHRFDTLTIIPHVKTSVLLAHGKNDWDIPHSHSTALFDALLGPYLPAAPTISEDPLSVHGWLHRKARKDLRAERRSTLVQTTFIRRFGTLEEFVDQKKGGRRVSMLKTNAGGHDIGRLEGVQDAIGKMFGFY